MQINLDLSKDQVNILKKLVERYKALFNNLPRIAYEHLDKWLCILVDLVDKLVYKTPPLFYNSLKDYLEIDKVFDTNRSIGRIREIPIGKGLLYTLQVFVARRNSKLWLVVDMRSLNTLVLANSYPIPQQDKVLDAIGGYLYITSLNVTSSFY